MSIPDLADAVHYLCLLHGRHPGVIDHAAKHTAENAAGNWLVSSADAFASERTYLTRLTVALGPIPSTHGHNECEAAVMQQRHALDMLAQSDRRGCAMGAAMTLVLDWTAARRLLDMAAIRIGIEPHKLSLSSPRATLTLADALSGDEMVERAMMFGARQLLRQHRGLWDLLMARANLRANN